MGEPDRELVVAAYSAGPKSLIAAICMMMAGNGHLRRRDGDLVGGREMADDLCWRARVEYIGIEVIAATPLSRVATGAVPAGKEGGGARRDDVGRAREQQVVDQRGASELDPTRPELGGRRRARCARPALAPSPQRQEADAAGPARHLDHVGLGSASVGHSSAAPQSRARHRLIVSSVRGILFSARGAGARGDSSFAAAPVNRFTAPAQPGPMRQEGRQNALQTTNRRCEKPRLWCVDRRDKTAEQIVSGPPQEDHMPKLPQCCSRRQTAWSAHHRSPRSGPRRDEPGRCLRLGSETAERSITLMVPFAAKEARRTSRLGSWPM